jgi:hypothetical protein
VSALRDNILSNTFDEQATILSNLDKHWEDAFSILKGAHYQITPPAFKEKGEPKGRLIYTSRARITEAEKELIVPGITHKEEILQDPIWIISIPMDSDFPSSHPNASLPTHWRGIFGELDLLLAHLEIQTNSYCAVESINKNKVETLDECRENLSPELVRRKDVLHSSLQKEEKSLYQLATNYWRVEECFWSVFHDDDRPPGCSTFDRLRNRVQAWRTTLRRILKFHIRDFAAGSDSLASINKYIGNIIITTTPKKNIASGMVVRELRPAIMVKEDQGSNRVLKGRVIAT